jgi:hypothetical protein
MTAVQTPSPIKGGVTSQCSNNVCAHIVPTSVRNVESDLHIAATFVLDVDLTFHLIAEDNG